MRMHAMGFVGLRLEMMVAGLAGVVGLRMWFWRSVRSWHGSLDWRQAVTHLARARSIRWAGSWV